MSNYYVEGIGYECVVWLIGYFIDFTFLCYLPRPTSHKEPWNGEEVS